MRQRAGWAKNHSFTGLGDVQLFVLSQQIDQKVDQEIGDIVLLLLMIIVSLQEQIQTTHGRINLV